MTLTKTKTSSLSRTNRSELRSEADLRGFVDKFYSFLPKEYMNTLQINDELRIDDTRLFTEYENRYLDSSFRTKAGITILEFKKGVITPDLIRECGLGRGYFELCYEQIADFNRFLFIGESVLEESKTLCQKITDKSKMNIKIDCTTYQKYTTQIFKHFLEWNNFKSSSIEIAVNIKQNISINWFDEEWIFSVMKSIIEKSV